MDAAKKAALYAELRRFLQDEVLPALAGQAATPDADRFYFTTLRKLGAQGDDFFGLVYNFLDVVLYAKANDIGIADHYGLAEAEADLQLIVQRISANEVPILEKDKALHDRLERVCE